jgi:hypothetical protein
LQARDDYDSSDFLANITYVRVVENDAVTIMQDLIVSINNMTTDKVVRFN